MNFRLGILFIFILFLCSPLPFTKAQKVKGNANASAQKAHQDSLQAARQQYSDSLHAAQRAALDSAKQSRQHILDSTKAARQAATDSMKAARKQITDSLDAIHKYRDSKHYKDSVTKARTLQANQLKEARQHILDSAKAARQHSLDSVTAIRKAHIDSVHVIQQKRADSMAAVNKYRQSKRYRDSVTVSRNERMEALEKQRKKFNDSVSAVRKKVQDSVRTAQKRVMDSTMASRNRYLDSMKTVRKAHTDSLAKVKADREKLKKSHDALNKQKLQMALDLKIKQKREKWSNQQMLKKKWTAPRKVEQNTFSRFNYYYNANRKMDEALANMQRAHKENYDSLIGLYPFDPNRDSTLLSSDMDSIIHKVSVGIQIHDPRTKWEDDLYLLLGEAYYYKGGYKNASASFRYIIAMDEQRKKTKAAEQGYSTVRKGPQTSIVENDKKTMLDFLKHKAVHNDAILWLSRVYTESGQAENAESVMSLLDSDPNLPDNLKGRIALSRAFTYLNDNDLSRASSELTIAAKDNNIPDAQRMRCAFLNGQLLERQGRYDTAIANFKEVLALNPKIDMDFYARKHIAYNTMYAGGKVDDMISSLKRLLTDGKYTSYYDQIYYILGQLASSAGNAADAVAYLQKSIHTPKASKKQKAISFATLGNVLYGTGDYVAAKSAYDSAAHMTGSDPGDTLMTIAVKRNSALSQVTGPIQIIHTQDSLLLLASLDTKQQLLTVRRYIRELQRRREDSIYRAQNAGVNAVMADESNNAGDAANWYFTNSANMQQGYNDFKRIWGNRPLVDNWRRNAAISFTNRSQQNSSGGSDSTANPNLDENGLPTEESLLALIPNTPEQKQKAQKTLQRAYIDLSNAYVRELEDYKHAIGNLDTLDKRYPEHDFKPEDYYLRYLVAMRQGNYDVAKTYTAKLVDQYPDSKYTVLVRPKDDSSAYYADAAAAVSSYYDQTYQLLVQHQYNDVLTRTQAALKKFDDTAYAKRFHIMQAIAFAGAGDYKSADTLLTAFMKTNGNDSLRGWADEVVKFMRANPSGPPQVEAGPSMARQWPYYTYTHNYTSEDDEAGSGSGNGTDSVYSTGYHPHHSKPVPYGVAANNLPAAINYAYDASAPHYVAIAFPGMDQRVVAMRNSVKQLIASNNSSGDLAVLIDLYSTQQGILLVRGFKDAASASTFMGLVAADTSTFDGYRPGEYNLFVISENNYKKLYFEQNIPAYLTFYNMTYRPQQQ